MKTFTLLIAILFAICLNNNYAQNAWKKKADFGGTARDVAVGFSIGSKGYLGTGSDGVSGTKDFWEYDPATNTWTQKADFGGTARYGSVGFSIGDKGYLGTGLGPSGITKDFWEYNPATNSWTRKADFGGGIRHYAVGFSIGSKGYIGTGNDAFSSYSKDFWEYDPAADTWTRKADFGGVARLQAVGFSIGGKGYLGTGVTQGGLSNDFWEYDPDANTWTSKTDFGGTARFNARGFSIGSKGYLGTGSGFQKDFWEYDPESNTWTRKADFGGAARWGTVGFSIGSKGYVGTGYSGSYYKDFWEYTPENACLAPTGMKVQDISDTAAGLKWEVSVADVLHVRVRYRVAGSTAWTIKNKNGAKPTVHIDGLTPNTTYQWQTRSFCAADTSGWVEGPDFTTTASFASTTSAITSSKLPGNIHVQITPNPNKGDFTIQLQLPSKAAITTFALYNNMGEKIWQQDAGKMSGQVSRDIALESKLSTGVYILMIQHGDSRLIQKVMVTE